MRERTRNALLIDTSAIVAEIMNEPGAEAVRKILYAPPEGGLFMHAVNVCEVAYMLMKFDFADFVAAGLAKPEGVEIIERVSRPLWTRAACLKTKYKNLSLGDCLAVAQAEILDADILTGDRGFQQVETHIDIKLFR